MAEPRLIVSRGRPCRPPTAGLRDLVTAVLNQWPLMTWLLPTSVLELVNSADFCPISTIPGFTLLFKIFVHTEFYLARYIVLSHKTRLANPWMDEEPCQYENQVSWANLRCISYFFYLSIFLVMHEFILLRLRVRHSWANCRPKTM